MSKMAPGVSAAPELRWCGHQYNDPTLNLVPFDAKPRIHSAVMELSNGSAGSEDKETSSKDWIQHPQFEDIPKRETYVERQSRLSELSSPDRIIPNDFPPFVSHPSAWSAKETTLEKFVHYLSDHDIEEIEAAARYCQGILYLSP
jgi:hypothetical protein